VSRRLQPALICINAAAPAAGKIGTHPPENLMNRGMHMELVWQH
jgi:hypothetical protein